MFRNLVFASLWTFVHGVVVLAVVTTTVSGAISTPVTSFPSQTIPQSACEFTSALDVNNNTVSVCECSSTIIAGIDLAVSGTSTTSYCALGGPVPTGFTQISAVGGQPLPTLFGNSTSCSSTSAIPSGGAGVGTNASFTSSNSTSKSPFTTITGTTSPTASVTGSGALKNGAAMCFGLLATTLVAIFLL